MNKTAKIDYSKVDYDKLNALNMQHESLGQAYLKFDWDPLGENFKLDLPYIEKYLKNARDKSEIKTPQFLSRGNREVKQCFKNALENNSVLKNELQSRYDSGEFADFKGVNIELQVKDILFFLNCREKMLEIAIGKLKNPNINTLKAYQNIYALNKKLSELLEETYKKEFDKKVIIQNFLQQAERERQDEIAKSKLLQEKMEHQPVQSNILMPLSVAQNFMNCAQKGSTILQRVVSTVKTVADAVRDMFE